MSSRSEKEIREVLGESDPLSAGNEIARCQVMEPPEMMVMPRRCGGKRIVDYGQPFRGRDHPDNRIKCVKCGAVFSMDGKDGMK